MGSNNTKPISNNTPSAQYSVSSHTRGTNIGQFQSTDPLKKQFVVENRTVEVRARSAYVAQHNVSDTKSNTKTGTALTAQVAGKTQSFEPDSKHPYQRLQSELTQEARLHHIHNQLGLHSTFDTNTTKKVVPDVPQKSSQRVAPCTPDRAGETLSQHFSANKFNAAPSSAQNSQIPKIQNVAGKTSTENFAPSAPTYSELHSGIPTARVIPISVTSTLQQQDCQKTMKKNLNWSSVGQSVGENNQWTVNKGVIQPHSSETTNILKQTEGTNSKYLVKEQTPDVSKTSNKCTDNLIQRSKSHGESKITASTDDKGENIQQQILKIQEDCEKINTENNHKRSENDRSRADHNRVGSYNHYNRGDAYINRKRDGRSKSGDHRDRNNRGRGSERSLHRKTEQGALGCQNDSSAELTENVHPQKSSHSSTEFLASTDSHSSGIVSGDIAQGKIGSHSSKVFYNEKKVSNSDFKQKQSYVPRKYFIGYHRLRELVDGDPEETVIVLANKHSGFYELLKDNLKPDWLVLVVKLLANICKTNVSDKKVGVLKEASSPQFHEQLSLYLYNKVSIKQNENDKPQVRSFICNLITFYETVMKFIPNTGCEPSMLVTIDKAIDTSIHYLGMSYTDEMLSNLIDLKKQINLIVENEGNGLQKEVHFSEEHSTGNFRELSVLPTRSELTSNREPFLRTILMQGAYTNVEHYLDVHFRLLKEDYIRPLREYINCFLKGKSKYSRNVRLYRKTYFMRLTMVGDKVGHIVNFDPDNRMERAKLSSCGMLRCGSLICFSNDNFRDVFFATVLRNNDFMLKRGLVVVHILDAEESKTHEMYTHPYMMIELKLKFDPYFHTLKALQKMEAGDFPMSQYIIEAVNQRVPPEYLCDAQNGKSKILKIDGKDVVATDSESWPNACQLQLDEFQYNAFRTALTEKFVLIQGPPGTGKKFLSCKIIETLIENRQTWNSKKTPILVICHREHTLDQLLEGFLKLTPNIVRIGGKTKNELIDQLNLKEKQKYSKRTGSTYHLFNDMRNNLSRITASFKKLEKDVDALDNNCGIVSISSLESCMPEVHVNSFKNNTNQVDNSMFLKWLEGGLSTSTTATNVTETSAYVDSVEETVCVQSNNMALDIAVSDEIDDDLGLEVDVNESIEYINFELDFKASQKAIDTLKETIKNIKKNLCEEPVVNSVQKYEEEEEELRKLTVKLKYFQNNLLSDQKMDQLHNVSDLWATDSATRWSLYKHWVLTLKSNLLEKLQQLALDFISKSKEFEEVKAMEEYEVLLNSDIVGITPAVAAHMQPLLKRLECKIALVTEANEILESQIAVFLTGNCQHLIMIGDSLQLRPLTSVYELRQKYKLDLSLFERMLNNDINCENLQTQHRMRSEFVRLLVPAIYPAIKTHASVKKYERIAGVVSNLFFVTHQQTEEEVPGLRSYRNPHEGDFLVALCRHLILQGHAPEKITILTTYVAQVFYIQQEQQSTSMLRDVKVICVDSFKGEENDIILLSLVRSNSDGNIDFWRVENRISGVLSRARKGFYIVGNMDCFTSMNDTWKKINSALKSMAAIGPSLALNCQFHSEHLTYVSSANDFLSLQDGGCQLPCNEKLPCGHVCPLSCHLKDRDHLAVRCTHSCQRPLAGCKLGHRCEKQCYEDCGVCSICENKVLKKLPCGHTLDVQNQDDAAKQLCTVSVLVQLPCGHETVKPCYRKSEKTCPHPCDNRLQCGHQCLKKCHTNRDPDHLRYQCRKKCGRKNIGCRSNHICQKACYQDCSPCFIVVKRELPCKHVLEIPCRQDPNDVKCQMNCEKMLQCGHPCKMPCGEPCGNCQVEVNKTIKRCGHSVKEKCSVNPNPNKCKSPCERLLPCGHKCTRMCGQPCATTCNVRVQRTELGACGHQLTIPCHMNTSGIFAPQQLLGFCNEPCNTVLECGHVCSGTCTNCFQGRVHQGCTKECKNVLICGHKCPVPCSANCPPCSRKCSHKCIHSKCANLCGEPCTPCREKCGWQCEHLKCTRQCHELCDRKPCYEPCKLKLKCGHNCIGFCGDPCPPLCRICDHKDVTDIFLGHEADADARFVLLEDCKHVIESKGLENWLEQSEGEIVSKVCPRCKTPITRTQRYLNAVKITLEDICKVKAKVFGLQTEIESKRSLLLDHITQLLHHSSYVIGSDVLKQHLGRLKQQLQPVKDQRRNQLSIMDTESLELHIKFMHEIVMSMRNASGCLDNHSITKIGEKVLFFMQIMESRGRYLSSQEVNDINCELNRFNAFIHLCRLESTKMYKVHCNYALVQDQHDIARKTVCSVKKFTAEQYVTFRQSLQNLNRILNNVIILPAQERQQILKAMNLKHGHWYKCPNGHLYVITECGRAMQISKCNECGAKIGGRRHTLLSSNRVATEMN